MNRADPDTRPVTGSAAAVVHPLASGGDADSVTAAAGTGDAADGDPTPVRLAPSHPASKSRKIPHAKTPKASSAWAGAVGAFNPNNDNARDNTPRNGALTTALTGSAVNTGTAADGAGTDTPGAAEPTPARTPGRANAAAEGRGPPPGTTTESTTAAGTVATAGATAAATAGAGAGEGTDTTGLT